LLSRHQLENSTSSLRQWRTVRVSDTHKTRMLPAVVKPATLILNAYLHSESLYFITTASFLCLIRQWVKPDLSFPISLRITPCGSFQFKIIFEIINKFRQLLGWGKTSSTYMGQYSTGNCGCTSMPGVGFETMISVFEQSRAAPYSGTATVICILVAYIVRGRSRVSSGSIVSDYGLDDRAIGVRSPAGAKDFSSSICVQTGSGAHPASCTMGTGGPFPGGKARPGRDAATHPHLVPRSRMSRSYTSSPPKRLHGV
jgi:hypothetical protein